MKLPWVSRRAFELVQEQLERVIHERDEYREEAARAKDELITRLGCEPVSVPVRAEMKESRKIEEEYLKQFEYEDNAGMLDPDILKTVDEAVSQEMPRQPN